MSLKQTLLSLTVLILSLGVGTAQALTLKIASIAPDGSTWMKEMRAGAKIIKERTGGRVKLKFYPGGVMGNDKAVLKKIRLGQLQGGALTGGALSHLYPDMQIYSLPMIIRSYDEADFVRAKLDPRLEQGLEKKGLATLGISEGGFAYIMSSAQIRSIEDLKAQKMWVPEGDVLTDQLFDKMGVNPIPLPIAEVYTGLQTGMIDSIGTTPTASLACQWHTKINAVTDVPLVYLIGVLAVDQKRFNKIKPADQQIVKEVMRDVFARLNSINRADDAKAIKALKNRNIAFVRPTDEEIASWAYYAEQAINEATGNEVSAEMLTEIRQLLSEFRSQSSQK
jgi:TRAP-type C4-dicarboxylate transport system substrate-binding protein